MCLTELYTLGYSGMKTLAVSSRLLFLVTFAALVTASTSFALPKIKMSSSSTSSSSSSSSSSPLRDSPSQSPSAKRKPWDFFRFLKTVTFYNKPRLPFFPSTSQSDGISIKVKPGDSLWNKAEGGVEWGALDDVVMGGVSKTDKVPQNFDGQWNGFVTPANNGGFAGIRTKLFDPPRDCSSTRGIVLTVTGDGNRYKFIGRDDTEWNGIAWSYSFDTTKDKKTQIKIPFDKLIPTKFAKRVSPSRSFNRSGLTGIQLTLSKFEYDGALNPRFTEGYFSLEVESIKLF